MNEFQITTWFKKAKPGDSIVYRTGKQLSSQPKVMDLSDAVLQVRHLYNQGKVELCQERLDDGFFAYIAQKRGVVRPPLPAFSKEGNPVHRFAGIPKAVAAGGL